MIEYVDPTARRWITTGSTPMSAFADVNRYYTDANTAGHAVLSFEATLRAPRRSSATTAAALAAELQAFRAALVRAQTDPLSEQMTIQERSVMATEGQQFAVGLSSIAGTVARGGPLTPKETFALSLYTQPFLSVALPTLPAVPIIARCVRHCGRVVLEPSVSGAGSPVPTIRQQLDMHQVIAQATFDGNTVIVAPGAKLSDALARLYIPGWVCLAGILPNQSGSGTCVPRSGLNARGALEIYESKTRVLAWGYVPAGTIAVSAAGRPMRLVGRLFQATLRHGLYTVTLTTRSGTTRSMLPNGIGGE